MYTHACAHPLPFTHACAHPLPFTHSLSHTLSHTHSLTRSLTYTLSHTLSYSLTYTLLLSHIHSLTLSHTPATKQALSSEQISLKTSSTNASKRWPIPNVELINETLLVWMWTCQASSESCFFSSRQQPKYSFFSLNAMMPKILQNLTEDQKEDFYANDRSHWKGGEDLTRTSLLCN